MSVDPQHSVIRLRRDGRLVRPQAEPYRDRALYPAFRLPVGREFRQQLQWARQVNQVGLAGVVEQAPECVLGRGALADADGMLGDAVKLPCVTCKPALIAEGVGYILNSDVVGIRKQRPEADAGEGCDRAIGHTTRKTGETCWAQFPTCRFSRRAHEQLLPWETAGWSLQPGGGHRRLPPRKEIGRAS